MPKRKKPIYLRWLHELGEEAAKEKRKAFKEQEPEYYFPGFDRHGYVDGRQGWGRNERNPLEFGREDSIAALRSALDQYRRSESDWNILSEYRPSEADHYAPLPKAPLSAEAARANLSWSDTTEAGFPGGIHEDIGRMLAGGRGYSGAPAKDKDRRAWNKVLDIATKNLHEGPQDLKSKASLEVVVPGHKKEKSARPDKTKAKALTVEEVLEIIKATM